MNVTQVIPFVTERYPWTHRIGFKGIGDQHPVYEWTEKHNIPGIWVNEGFYTTEKYVTIVALRWSHL